jgi:hypothetical protein
MASGGTEDAQHERRVFVRTMLLTLVLAVPAMLLVATCLIGWRDTRGACAAFWPQLAVGFAAMLGFTLATAPVLAARCARSPSLLGPFCALLFAFGDAAGCLANWIGEGGGDGFDWFVKPFAWLLLFGALPAFLLGGVAMLLHGWFDRRL